MSGDLWGTASARALLALICEPDLALGPDFDPETFAPGPWRQLAERYVDWLGEPGAGNGGMRARLVAFLRSVPDEELPTLGAASRAWLMERLRAAVDGQPLRDPLEELAELRREWSRAVDGSTGDDINDRNDQSPPADPPSVVSVVSVVPKWPAPMAPAAFHGLAGKFVELVSPHTEADPAALLLGFLIQVGREIGRTAYVQVGAARHHPNLFAVVVGPSGAAGRKGTAYSESERLVELAVPGAGARTHKGAASGEGVIWAVRDAITKLGKDGAEELVDPGIADKRLLLREGEFSAVLRVAARDSNTLSVVLRDAWDGSNLQTLAKNSPATATRPHICLLADITPDELRRELTATDRANGFGNRILWCCSRRSRLLPDGGEPDPARLQELADRLAAALGQVDVMGRVERDEEARDLWHAVYPQLTRERPGLLGALLARAEAQVVRLSLIYAVLDGYHMVRREHLEAALAVWRYCEDSAAYIFGARLGDPLADELLGALRREPDGLTRTEIRDLLGKNRTGEEIGRALELLERHGLAWREREDSGGRPRERWRAYDRTTEVGRS